MITLIFQVFLWLLAAFLLGLFIGWLIRPLFCKPSIHQRSATNLKNQHAINRIEPDSPKSNAPESLAPHDVTDQKENSKTNSAIDTDSADQNHGTETPDHLNDGDENAQGAAQVATVAAGLAAATATISSPTNDDEIKLVKEELAAEKMAKEEVQITAEAERLAEEQRLAQETEAARLAEEKKIAIEKAEAERLAEEQRLAQETEAARVAEEKKIAAEKAEAERLAEEQRLAQETEAARLAEEKKIAAEKAEAERLAEEQRLAAEADAVRLAKEKKTAAEKAEAERLAEEQRLAQEAETARVIEEKRIAAEKVEAERLAEAADTTISANNHSDDDFTDVTDEMRPERLDAPKGGKADDLKEIRGIGPVIEKTLNTEGVYHFQQIANFTPENVRWVDKNVAIPGRIHRDDWIGQAKCLISGREYKGHALPAETHDTAPTPERITDDMRPARSHLKPNQKADDLKLINGIGPVIEETLNDAGVYFYQQVADFTDENTRWVDNHMAFPGRIHREDWIGQAKKLLGNSDIEITENMKPVLLDAPNTGGAEDLKRIKGIGKVLERRLHTLGIYHYQQIAELTHDNICWLTDYISFPEGRIESEDWVGQAKRLAHGENTEYSDRFDNGETPYK